MPFSLVTRRATKPRVMARHPSIERERRHVTDKRGMRLDGSNLCFVLTRRGRQMAKLWDACVVRGGGSDNEAEWSACESVFIDGRA